jgi:hypothetical protein
MFADGSSQLRAKFPRMGGRRERKREKKRSEKSLLSGCFIAQ